MDRARLFTGLSATLLGLAMSIAGLWWGCFTTDRLLHDDAAFTTQLTASLDRPDVRAQLSTWLLDAIRAAAKASGAKPGNTAAWEKLTDGLSSEQQVAPLADRLVAALVDVRDRSVAQLDAHAVPKAAVAMDLSGVLKQLGLSLDKKTAAALGLRITGGRITVPVVSSASLDSYQQRYDQTMVGSRWGGWLALVLAIAAIALSRRPLRVVALAAVGVAVLALLAGPLASMVSGLLGRDAIGALLQPAVDSTGAAIGAGAGFVVAVGVAAAALCLAADWFLQRRTS